MKNRLYLLILVIVFSLTACGSLSTTRELEPGLTIEDVALLTVRPEIEGKRVALKANIEVDVDKLDQELVWGFMWFEDNGSAERETHKLTVGRGFFSGDYKFYKDDFTSGTKIAYCAFVEFKASSDAEVEELLGDEVFFDAQ